MPVQEILVEENDFVFETVMRIRGTEVDVGQYLTMHALASILAEAKSRFLYSKGITDVDSSYQGLVVTDVSVNLPERVLCREELLIEVGVPNIDEKEAIFKYKVSRMYDGSEVARASMNIANFDYRYHKFVAMPKRMIETLEQVPFEL